MHLSLCPYGIPGSRGRGGTPLYKPYRYVPPQWVGCLCCFCLKTGIDFAHFGLESGMVFEGITGMYDIFIVSISNELRKKEKYSNSYFLAVLIKVMMK